MTIGYYITLAARHPVGFEGYYTLEDVLNGTKVNGKFTVRSEKNGLCLIGLEVDDNVTLSGDARILSLYNSPYRADRNLLWRGNYSDNYKMIEPEEFEVYNKARELKEGWY